MRLTESSHAGSAEAAAERRRVVVVVDLRRDGRRAANMVDGVGLGSLMSTIRWMLMSGMFGEREHYLKLSLRKIF